MKRLAVFCAGLGAAASAAAGHFFLQATLRDGKALKGYVPEKRGAFEGITVDGKTVTVRFEKLPSYAKRPWSQEIAWEEKRRVFVLRAPWWTGELERIWDKLALDPRPPGDAGRSPTDRELDAVLDEQGRIVLRGNEIAEVKIRYIDPAKEAVEPDKRKKK